MKQKPNSQTMHTTDLPQDGKWSDPKSEAINSVQSDLTELLAEGANEECGIPRLSDAAFHSAWELITDTARIMKGSFPYDSVSSDGEGGVRIEWRRGDKGVRLAVPADPGQSYIYYESGDDYALDKEVSAGSLSNHLAG